MSLLSFLAGAFIGSIITVFVISVCAINGPSEDEYKDNRK